MIHLTVTSLKKSFGRKVVFNGLSFTSTSRVIGVSGINGSGKSTLLRCLSGLLAPSKGSIEWNVKSENYTPKKIRGQIGYVAPYINLYEELTVFENLNFLIQLQSVKSTNSDTIKKHLLQFDAHTLVNQPFGDLSTGQQQRIKLTAAILHKPDILFLDEPGTNLDSKGKQSVRRLIDSFRNQNKMLILASNQADELDQCDEILELTNN
ncbi:MAG: ABC transporter ATP-binding protein [Balneolaceae bacterium]